MDLQKHLIMYSSRILYEYDYIVVIVYRKW